MRINIKCILSRLPVFIIFVMIFGEAYGVTIIGNLYRIILGVLGCLSLFIYVIFHKIKYTNLDLLPFLYTLIALFLLLVSIFFGVEPIIFTHIWAWWWPYLFMSLILIFPIS